MRNRIILINSLIVMLIMLLGMAFFPSGVEAEEKPRFLVIHLDAVSAADFYQFLEQGSIPNIERVFARGGHIFETMALFPGGTEVTVPRMKSGGGIAGEGPSGWGYFDYDDERMITKPEVALEYTTYVTRRARGNLINVLPVLEYTGGLDMMNIPALLERYQAVEFFWFATDFYGHYFGAEQHLNSVQRFDRYFGRMVDQLDLEEINLILYVDHGMTFGESEILHYSARVEEIAGDYILGERYPNIYLQDEYMDKRGELAREIAGVQGIDLAFIQETPDRVVGYHNEARVIFSGRDDKIRYEYEGQDIFDYYELGYEGEYLDHDEWLKLTRSAEYPAVPPLIYPYFDNPRTGEIVTVINHPYIFASPLVFLLPVEWMEETFGFSLVMGKGSHAGLRHTDLLVASMVRGPDLKHFYEREAMWLQDILPSIPELDFDSYEPERELHSLRLGSNLNLEGISFSAAYSPAYRLHLGLDREPGVFQGWLEGDFFSTHSLRLWMGAGLIFDGTWDSPHWLLRPRVELNLGSLRLEWRFPLTAGGFSQQGTLSYPLRDGLRLEWNIYDGFGLSYSF